MIRKNFLIKLDATLFDFSTVGNKNEIEDKISTRIRLNFERRLFNRYENSIEMSKEFCAEFPVEMILKRIPWNSSTIRLLIL